MATRHGRTKKHKHRQRANPPVPGRVYGHGVPKIIYFISAQFLCFAPFSFMARHKAILQPDFPYNITARCINREWFNLPMDVVWEIFRNELNKTITNKNLVVHCFVLMSNHFHLIASTPDANISDCMHQFMTQTSKKLTKAGNRINETFAGRHYKCILQNYSNYLNAYKYNYRNPVTAGICSRVEDYPFSTLRETLRHEEKKVLTCEDPLLATKEITLKWLNTAPDISKVAAVKLALKRPLFQIQKNRNDGKPILEDDELL